MSNKPYHVLPVNDTREHDEHCGCWCRPEWKDGVIVHNSDDGREYHEPDGKKLN